MKLDLSKEWYEKNVTNEPDCDIGAGSPEGSLRARIDRDSIEIYKKLHTGSHDKPHSGGGCNYIREVLENSPLIKDLESQLAANRIINEKLLYNFAKKTNEISQIIGKALGYPWYKDDKKNFPEATEEDGICTGEHTAVTIAMECVAKLSAKDAEIRTLKEMLQTEIKLGREFKDSIREL